MNTIPTHSPGRHCFADQPLVSVIVDNYNYASFLPDAIESALQQHYPRTEIIVVDDGSTDHSRKIVAEYGTRIVPVYKNNGGQASALNAGFAASRGDIILFLDSDDILFPTAATNVVNAFCQPGISNVHWSMWTMDAGGNRTGGMKPPRPPAEGDFREQMLALGPSNVPCAPTSGNAWSRSFLEPVLPIPEHVPYYRLCADEYLYTLAPVFGRLRTIAEPQGCYRIHGKNVYSGRSFREKLNLELAGYDQHCRAVAATLKRNGVHVNTSLWSKHSWFHRLERAVTAIFSTVPEDATFVLVDGGTWDAAEAFGRRRVRPFYCVHGDDWGPPAD
ncbi:MAG: glycosyltransferase, partial [Planctomycetes bacterium]|nr:glycosyltransferase [Planctomycetota bacterium]